MIACIVAIMMLMCCFATLTHAATHNVYDSGNLPTTYVTYFKDILSGQSILSDYVAFRSGQNSYTLVVGDIEYNSGSFSASNVTSFEFSTESSNYNPHYNYYVTDLSSFSLDAENQIIYSNLGSFPQLIERSANFEILNTVLISVFILGIVINRIFRGR